MSIRINRDIICDLKETGGCHWGSMMCHWVLRVWQCGESYFTKYSPCSFDRAIRDPRNTLLNPLHPSIRPIEHEKTPAKLDTTPRSGSKKNTREQNKAEVGKSETSQNERPTASREASITHLALPTINAGSGNNSPTPDPLNIADYARDAQTGAVIPVLLAEVGKASNLSGTLGEEGKCRVFEVVLDTKETTVCPACARYVSAYPFHLLYDSNALSDRETAHVTRRR
ncbi:hypothetical protein BDV96DRAFT_636304 [Lophiotrema nucula]|uniref:Uncharacterized protein n=1 Tax=Lophiotrema nucula TaxID=690887 RepID=A0A6A5YQA1_9PLEO|nr:hypothetical protein BDV96DRAFT_636304 [Lophiotrema nucula]